jgi:hypothetical protein
MRDLARFATADRPLRSSGLRSLVECPWRSVLKYLAAEEEDDHGVAGDTGSAMHKAAAAFHKGKDLAESLGVMQAHTHEYPLADLQDAASLFLTYAQDPRNREATILLCEEKVTFTIAAAPEDPTGEAIVVEGTVDQVRMESGRPRVWDIKTSKKDPTEVRAKTTHQAAAYCIGASMRLNMPVHPGGIIMPRKYRADGSGPVFWHFTFKFEDIEQILLPVRLRVAEIRRKQLYHVPNENCGWCHQRSEEVCLPKLQELRVRL